MSQSPPFEEQKAHQWFAIECNNQAWGLLESTNRGDADDELLVHTAHASCYHWMQVGGAIQQARAECLVANAHAAVGSGESALRHANRSIDLTESKPDGTADWDLAFAYDALARASAAAGDDTDAAEQKKKARELGDAIAAAEDKSFFDQWFAR